MNAKCPTYGSGLAFDVNGGDWCCVVCKLRRQLEALRHGEVFRLSDKVDGEGKR